MPNNVIKSFAEKTGLSVSTLEGYWEKAKESAKKKFKNEKTSRFWRYVTGVFKKMMKNKIKNEHIDIKLNISNELLENFKEEISEFLINKIIDEKVILESLENEKELEKDKMLEELEDNMGLLEKKEKREFFNESISKPKIDPISEKYMNNLLNDNKPIKQEIKKQMNFQILKENKE